MALLPTSLQKKLDEADAKAAGLTEEEIDAKLGPMTRWLFRKLEGRAPPPTDPSQPPAHAALIEGLQPSQEDVRATAWHMGAGLALVGLGWGMGTMLHGVDTFGPAWWTTTAVATALVIALMAAGLRMGKPLPYLGAVLALLVASAQGDGDVHAAAAGLPFLALALLSMLLAPKAPTVAADHPEPVFAMPTSPLAPHAVAATDLPPPATGADTPHALDVPTGTAADPTPTATQAPPT